jgi:hypothetical protein
VLKRAAPGLIQPCLFFHGFRRFSRPKTEPITALLREPREPRETVVCLSSWFSVISY